MASLSIASLSSFFAGEQKSIERGENHVKSDHVESYSYTAGVIRGEIHASMKKKTYKVTVSSNAYYSSILLDLVRVLAHDLLLVLQYLANLHSTTKDC